MQGVDPRTGPFSRGDRFLKYEIQGVLGRGGHAFVYDGYDPFLDRRVAIKIIVKPAETGRDLSKRAQLEARVLCRLQHPNVVHVIDAGATDRGFVYIIMELLEGRTLREAIVELGRLTIAEALFVGAQIADGVHAAHEQQAVHRDLKPENVFLQASNTVKVLDFGIAKFLGQGAVTTRKDLLQGTLLYMSPEHLQGFGVTPRSDIFALGSMLYEALAGRPPCLLGVQEPAMNVIAYAQVHTMPPPLDQLTGTVPRYVARTIQRMVAKNPDDRFATMAEVAQALRGNLHRWVNEADGAYEAPRDIWKKVGSSDQWLGSQDGSATERVDPSFLGAPSPIREPRPTDTERLDENAPLEPPPELRDHPAFKNHRRPPVTAQDTPPALASGLPNSSRHSVARRRSLLGPIIGAAIATGAVVGTVVGLMRFGTRSGASPSAASTSAHFVATVAAIPSVQSITAPSSSVAREPASTVSSHAITPAPASTSSSPAITPAPASTSSSPAIAGNAQPIDESKPAVSPSATARSIAAKPRKRASPSLVPHVSSGLEEPAKPAPSSVTAIDYASVKSGL